MTIMFTDVNQYFFFLLRVIFVMLTMCSLFKHVYHFFVCFCSLRDGWHTSCATSSLVKLFMFVPRDKVPILRSRDRRFDSQPRLLSTKANSAFYPLRVG